MRLTGRRNPATPALVSLPTPRDPDADLLHDLERYAVSCLASNEPVVVIATAEHLHQLRERLAALGYDDVVLGLDAQECLHRLTSNGAIDPNLFWLLASGLLRSRAEAVALACQGMVAVLRERGDLGAVRQLDELWSRVRRAEVRAEAANPPPVLRLAA